MYFIFVHDNDGVFRVYGPHTKGNCENIIQALCNEGLQEIHSTTKKWLGHMDMGQPMGKDSYMVVYGEHIGVETTAKLIDNEGGS